MRMFIPIVWIAAVLLAASLPAIRVQSPNQEVLTPFVPLRPLTREDLARREALELYAIGLLQQHDDRLIEATGTFEEALHLRSGSNAFVQGPDPALRGPLPY